MIERESRRAGSPFLSIAAMVSGMKRFLQSEQAVSSVEYALLASLVAVVCVGIITAVGLNALNLYTVVCNGVAAATGNPPC